jgi:hypothetical protein
MKVGFKWVCQVGAYMALYVAKYIFSQHLKRGHDLVVEKRKLSGPSTCENVPCHHHYHINACVLSDAYAM